MAHPSSNRYGNDERPLSTLPEAELSGRDAEEPDHSSAVDMTHRPSDGSIDSLPPPLITRRQGSHQTFHSELTKDDTAPPTPYASQVHLETHSETSSVHDEDAKDTVSPTTLRIRYGYSSQPVSRAPSIYSRGQSNLGSQPADLFRRASSARLSVPRRTTLTETPGGAAAFRRPKKSTQLRDEIPKPWLKYKDPAHRWAKWIFWSIWVLSLGLVAVLCYLGYRSVPNIGRLCMVMDDDFSTGMINPSNWMHEVRVDGYGFGQFEWTTDSPNNSYIADQTLYIVPTLTGDAIGTDLVTDGYKLNLTADGTCSSTNVSQCVASSNSSLGMIINPVQSARLKSKVKMKYGKIEIVARLPQGDWLSTGIRLLPSDDVYGEWPRSGEIGMVNARGNGPSYPDLGNDNMWSALHWGPFKEFDSYFRSWGIRKDRRNGYTKQFKTYSLEWNEKYLTTYIDNKVQTILDVKFDEDLWTKGNYPAFWQKGVDETIRLENPWYTSNNINAPFDQDFELVMGVSVGGTSGQFPDNLGGKPWQDSSVFAMNDFWTARDRWMDTWPENKEERGLAVKSVKMWRTC